MVVCIVRIILGYIAFRDDRIDYQVEEQLAVLTKNLRKEFTQMILSNDLLKHQVCTRFQAAAP